MGAPISTMIGIRTGGVFSGDVDIDDLKERIIGIIKQLEEEGEFPCDIGIKNLHCCMSNELTGSKGAYVTIAGVFNYWNYESTSEFGKMLSKEFGVEVMVMTWDTQNSMPECGVFLDGKGMNETYENQVSKVLRRM